jgi:hypothetical protein
MPAPAEPAYLEPVAPDSTVGVWTRVSFAALIVVLAVEALSWFIDVGAGVDWVPLGFSVVVAPWAIWTWSRRNEVNPAALFIAAFCTFVLAALAPTVGAALVAALVLAAAAEETVYRVAVPVAVLFAAQRLGVRRHADLLAGAFAVVIFSFLPGHVAQMAQLGPLPWAALAIMWLWMLWRGMPVWVVALSHAALNTAAAALDEGASPLWWSAVVGVPVLTVAAWGAWSDRRERQAATAAT